MVRDELQNQLRVDLQRLRERPAVVASARDGATPCATGVTGALGAVPARVHGRSAVAALAALAALALLLLAIVVVVVGAAAAAGGHHHREARLLGLLDQVGELICIVREEGA